MKDAKESAFELLTRALSELREGRLDSAENLSLKLLALSPRDPGAHVLAATLALRRARYEEADRWARSCLALRPRHAPAMLIAGRAARATGDFVNALEWFRQSRRTFARQARAVLPALRHATRMRRILRRKRRWSAFSDNSPTKLKDGARSAPPCATPTSWKPRPLPSRAQPKRPATPRIGSILAWFCWRSPVPKTLSRLSAARWRSRRILSKPCCRLLKACVRSASRGKPTRICGTALTSSPTTAQVFYALGLVCDDSARRARRDRGLSQMCGIATGPAGGSCQSGACAPANRRIGIGDAVLSPGDQSSTRYVRPHRTGASFDEQRTALAGPWQAAPLTWRVERRAAREISCDRRQAC